MSVFNIPGLDFDFVVRLIMRFVSTYGKIFLDVFPVFIVLYFKCFLALLIECLHVIKISIQAFCHFFISILSFGRTIV